MSGIKEIIRNQENFCDRVCGTLILLRAFAGNPKDFELLFSGDILKDFGYPEKPTKELDRVAEFCDELMDSIGLPRCSWSFVLVGNGIFSSLCYSGKNKKKSSMKEIIEYFNCYSGPWEI